MPTDEPKVPIDPIRLAVGQRLAAARELSKKTQDEVGALFGVKKGTVSAWETGRGDPGIYRLRELAKLYKVSADGLLWADAPTVEAMQMAAQFDALNERQRNTLKAVWIAFISESASDAQVEQGMPITKTVKESP